MSQHRHAFGPEPDHGEWFVIGAPGGSSAGAIQASGGIGSIREADPCFDSGAFVEWADSVYRRAIAAWRDRHPELLRPVMAEVVWDRYAQFLLTVSALALGRKLMSTAQATAALAGAGADGHSQRVIVSYAVNIASAQAALIDERSRRWQERWMFQRPAESRTHASGSVAVCPVCGAPADPAESGRCRYCQSDITTRTAGWLVTQVATTMYGAPRIGGRDAATPVQPPRAP